MWKVDQYRGFVVIQILNHINILNNDTWKTVMPQKFMISDM